MIYKLLKSGMSVLNRNGQGVILIFKNPFVGFPCNLEQQGEYTPKC